MASRRTLRRQAKAEAYLRTAPQASALREMLAQAVSDRDSAIKAATGAATGVTHAINAARPQIEKVYGGAIGQANTISQTVDERLQGMGAPASPIRASIERERGVGQVRLSESLANALTDLSNQRVSAAAGRAYATENALNTYTGDKAKIGRQAMDLAEQAGVFTSTRYGELVGDQRKQQFTAREKARDRRATSRENTRNRRNQRITSGVDAQGQIIPGGPKDPKVKAQGENAKPLTAAEQRARGQVFAHAKDQIGKARDYIKQLSAKNSPEKIKHYLTVGLNQAQMVPVIDPKTKKAQTDARGQVKLRKQTVKIPAFDATFVNAAVELEDKGFLSERTVHDLRAQKIHVPKDWLPVKVKFHYRRPKSSGGGFADTNLPAGSRNKRR